MPALPNHRPDALEEVEAIKVGDRVKSYDFPDFSDEHYVEGTVELTSVVLEGVARYGIRRDDGVMVYPPRNGTPHAFGGYTNGVRKV